MAAQTQMYIYNQRQSVVLLVPGALSATRRYEIVYSKDLTLIRGVDNVIEFAFINTDQRYVNVDGKDITARIIDSTGTQTLLQKTLTPIYPITGLMSLLVNAADLEAIESQKAYYSIEIPSGTFNYPVFVDSQGGGRGVMNIVDSTLPRFVPAKPLTVPTHPWPPASNGHSTTYYTSVINTTDHSVLTLQTQYSDFTGSTQVQGSILADFSVPYTITPIETYTAYTGTVGINITGYHPFVRMVVNNDGTMGGLPTGANATSSTLGGDIVSILAR